MIKKIYRLKEKEVKKVLKKGKPFFSYGTVLNYGKNNFSHNRFAIIISKKSVKNNVSRNYFRRLFFSLPEDNIQTKIGMDMVFVVKKNTKLDKNDLKSIKSFKDDINFLVKKVLNN